MREDGQIVFSNRVNPSFPCGPNTINLQYISRKRRITIHLTLQRYRYHHHSDILITSERSKGHGQKRRVFSLRLLRNRLCSVYFLIARFYVTKHAQ